jgi:hypothetical protein
VALESGFPTSQKSWLDRALSLFTDVRAGEGPSALLLTANIFCLLAFKRAAEGTSERAAWMLRGAAVCLAIHTLTAVPLLAQEPTTRAEALRREREAKSTRLTPPESGRLERTLLALENGRLFERILNPAEGFFPKVGNITTGSGFSFGPAYRKRGLFGDESDFSVFAAGSFSRYWMLDAKLTLPRLAGDRMFADLHGRRYDFPQEDFFGLGPDSRREDDVTYGLRSTQVGGTAGIRLRPWLGLSGSVDYLTPRIHPGDGSRPINALFSPVDAPGLDVQPDFIRYEVLTDLNYRQPLGNPRRGGRYALLFQLFDDRNGNQDSFQRFELDLQQYISILKERRVLALHALASVSDAGEGQAVPFYLQRTLGGPDDLRGFRHFRFRDQHLLLLQAEYRWEIFTAVDGAIFYDTGKVASRREDLDLRNLESDYGIGFRFGTSNGVFLRVEGAFGSSAGKHFILRFGNVF